MFNSYGDCINPVYLELRKIYCCRGAAFCGPELEKAWKEIERLEKEIQKLKGKKNIMKITLTRLEDAVPEMVELEFVNDSLMTSIVLTLEEAENIRKSLGKVLKDIATEVPEVVFIGGFEVPKDVYDEVVRLLKGNQVINAIKYVREKMSLGLKEAKCDIVDKIRDDLRTKGGIIA